jgi:hypothetical protein
MAAAGGVQRLANVSAEASTNIVSIGRDGRKNLYGVEKLQWCN